MFASGTSFLKVIDKIRASAIMKTEPIQHGGGTDEEFEAVARFKALECR
jgi:hypothetical protein